MGVLDVLSLGIKLATLVEWDPAEPAGEPVHGIFKCFPTQATI